MPIRDKKRGKRVSFLKDRKILEKDFGENDNNGKDSMKWSNRVKDWYNSERRFVFACKNYT